MHWICTAKSTATAFPPCKSEFQLFNELKMPLNFPIDFPEDDFPVDVHALREQGYDMICVLGPTASGKTRFAVELALRWSLDAQGQSLDGFRLGAEIISADSRQVYRGMDIGTGKDMEEYTVDLCSSGQSPHRFITVPCHLTDIVPAGTKYNLFEYRRDFLKVYNQIKGRGRMPVLCGGSGLYIESATLNYELRRVDPDPQLRASLEGRTMEELKEMLVRLKAARGDKPHNITDFDTKKRVIRAIEIERAEAGMVAGMDSEKPYGPDREEFSARPSKCKYIGIKVDRDTRNRRIDMRLKRRLENGLVEEVKGLLDGGIPAEDLIYYGLEYKFVTRYLLGEMEYGEMVEKLAIAIHQFAKRQMTWFRGMERRGIEIQWVEWGSCH